ncbi:MAG TPA: sensor domain-containing diguanylate cyclase [Actinomycetales bacterium]|nr:sensor domain-containing diguanylate cyclase [Actinomycetales bacterium]
MTASPGDPAVTTLSELALTIRSATSLDDVVAAVAEASLALLDADAVRVLRVDNAHGRLLVLHRSGASLTDPGQPLPESYLLATYPLAIADPDTGRTLASRADDPDLHERDRENMRRIGVRASLRIPVVVPGLQWGVVYATRHDDRPFTTGDVCAGEVIGTLTGAAVDRLERHDDLKRLALTDPMTGLANRRAVDDVMERWASDPVLARTMTVVLCDVNGLKQVNDTFGHASGDQLICETANVIASCSGLLPDAVAARIGGDEFLIASARADREQVVRALDELVTSASLLPLGDGLSCGSARGDDIRREELSPSARVRSLLRMADAEQYRQKLASRQRRAAASAGNATASAPPTTWSPAHDHSTAMATVTAVAEHLRTSDDPIEVRLGLVAAAVCEVAFGAAWWVSRIDLADGVVRAEHCGTPRAEGDRDGAWQDVLLDPSDFSLADYPATALAATGRSFAVDAEHGDEAERRLLLELGFSSVIGSGGPGTTPDEAWLVEVYGDALTPDIARSEALLHVMTALALPTPATGQDGVLVSAGSGSEDGPLA